MPPTRDLFVSVSEMERSPFAKDVVEEFVGDVQLLWDELLDLYMATSAYSMGKGDQTATMTRAT